MSDEVLSENELVEEIKRCPEWEIVQGKTIERWVEFEEFMEAIDFVNLVADVAEEAGHHPDISIRYNKVLLSLTTHEMGGVTEADVELAARLDHLID